jgi:hypothetical protein
MCAYLAAKRPPSVRLAWRIALRPQILAARSIIGEAIRPIKRLADQAKLDAENQQGEGHAVVLTGTSLRGGLAASYVAASVEPADRDLA